MAVSVSALRLGAGTFTSSSSEGPIDAGVTVGFDTPSFGISGACRHQREQGCVRCCAVGVTQLHMHIAQQTAMLGCMGALRRHRPSAHAHLGRAAAMRAHGSPAQRSCSARPAAPCLCAHAFKLTGREYRVRDVAISCGGLLRGSQQLAGPNRARILSTKCEMVHTKSFWRWMTSDPACEAAGARRCRATAPGGAPAASGLKFNRDVYGAALRSAH